MRTLGSNTTKVWRWIFLVMETVVFVFFFLGMTLEMWFGVSVQPKPEFLELPLGITCFVSWIFLLIASPFFFKSLRVVAVVGWIIAVAILFISFGLPARAGHL